MAAVSAEAENAELVGALLASRPNLFSNGPVFISALDLKTMLDVVAVIEAAATNPAYQDEVLRWAPTIARRDFGPRGVFMLA